MYSINDIKSFDGQKVYIKFTDGCSMDLKIVETLHLDEGDDFIGQILKVHCQKKEHYHADVGTTINICREDVAKIKKL